MKNLIIYDLDGTIVDTRKDIADAANHALQALGKPTLPQAQVERFVGWGLRYFIRNCLKTEDPDIIARGSEIYRAYYSKHMLDHSRLYPGVQETLDYFKDRSQAVLTRKPDLFSHEILSALGVADYFFQVIAGDSDYPKKPDPGAVLMMMESRKVTASETVFVGDSLMDIEAGKNAGVTAVALAHGFTPENELKSAQPDLVFSNFNEFLNYVRRHQW